MKDNRQIDDFGRFLNNYCNFGLFLAKNKKIPKSDCFEIIKIEEKKYKKKDLPTYLKYLIYHSYSMNLMILLIGFVICNVLGYFLPF